MSCRYKKALLFLCILFLLNIAGCATIQPTIKELGQKLKDFWKELKGEMTEKQTGTREEAIKKYGLKGLKEGLIVEPPIITPQVVKPGDKVKQEVQFALLAPEEKKHFNVSEIVVLSSGRDMIELMRRSSEKTQGIHLSTIEFTIPADLALGKYKLITTLGSGEHKKTVSAGFNLQRER
jgi:hypothetical protein